MTKEVKANEEPMKNGDNGTNIESTNTKGGCCSNTKQFFLYDNGRRDVQAFYFNQFGRSILFISFLFLSLGVLQFANQQVRFV